MKQFLLILLCLFTTALFSAKNCECGTHEDGVNRWTVEGKGCCSSPLAAGSIGFHETYINNEGVWEVDTTTQTTAQEAKDECCPKV